MCGVVADKDLFELALMRPLYRADSPDSLKIVSGYATHAIGKGIETPQDNSEIGRYFRNRLGLASGAYISVDDLKRYGRTNVVFYKLDDENYVMDFAKPK